MTGALAPEELAVAAQLKGTPALAIDLPKNGLQSCRRPSARRRRALARGLLAAALPAARRGASAAQVYAFVPLPEGALVPPSTRPNFRAPEAVSSALRSALSQVAPRTRAITVILPDPSSGLRARLRRFPAKAADAVSVVRFRLRKRFPSTWNRRRQLPVLTQSESEYRVLGASFPAPSSPSTKPLPRRRLRARRVLSSSLAALAAAGSMEGVLAANLGANSITTAVASGHDCSSTAPSTCPRAMVPHRRNRARHRRRRRVFRRQTRRAPRNCTTRAFRARRSLPKPSATPPHGRRVGRAPGEGALTSLPKPVLPASRARWRG